ncbi:heparinase II/III family protein [Shewanella marisflavi]|uniref:heparinase II/III domain-containing protein n=1 Tax=Shewanella marisflavi TaxID=260364 RepID=UPI00200E1FAC|nr:heparinase II/III family protein [Shewanella marisflavi]MCL1040923.1 heparinase II/III family protein [Shewanella marisflavi]
MKKNLFWYLNRLRKMSVLELLSRIQESILLYIDSFLVYNHSIDFGGVDSVRIENIKSSLGNDVLNNTSGILSVLSDVEQSTLNFDNTKHFKKIQLPLEFDLRAYWESQRFNQVIIMALSDDCSNRIFDFVSTWMKDNPPLKGCNYISTMECAIRCINLYSSLAVLKEKGTLTDNLLQLSYDFFNVNYKLIKHRISKFSSRGNHTIFEYAGLAVCCEAMSLENKNEWVKKAIDEFDAQTNLDGSGIEQSTAYHLFNIEVIWFIQQYFSLNDYKSLRISQAINFCSYFLLKDKLLRIGDSDSSCLFSHVFIKNSLARNHTPNTLLHFNDSGIIIMSNQKASMYNKYGKLGLRPLYGHGHYDFLSLVIVDEYGELITADSQTYLYNSSRRSKMRSSYYHSMPICGVDDLKQVSAFSWDRSGCGQLVSLNKYSFIVKYVRNDSVEIVREVHSGKDFFVVVDYVINSKKPFSSSFLVIQDVSLFKFYSLEQNFDLSLTSYDSIAVEYSESYGSISENPISRIEVKSQPNCKLVTVINFRDQNISKGEIVNLLKSN